MSIHGISRSAKDDLTGMAEMRAEKNTSRLYTEGENKMRFLFGYRNGRAIKGAAPGVYLMVKKTYSVCVVRGQRKTAQHHQRRHNPPPPVLG